MEMNHKVLLFGTMGDIGETVLKSLRDTHGINAVLVDFPQNMFHDEPGYRIFLDRAIREHEPDVIIPIGSQLALARFREGVPLPKNYKVLPKNIHTIAESSDKIMLLDSKVRCSALAAQLGIAQPQMLNNADAVDYDRIEWGRVIFKRDSSFGGSGVFRPRTRQALDRLIAQQPGRPFLVEEFIEGYDVSVDAVRFPGFYKAACYRTLARKQGQGPASERMAIDFPELCQTARRILDHIDYNGVCGFDFRISESTGQAYFLECNPRFTGGIGTQIEAGFDIPYEILRNWRGLNSSM